MARLHLALLLLACAATAISAPKIQCVQARPGDFVLRGNWASQHIVVTAHLSDDTVRDVTGETQFRSGNRKTALVSKTGLVTPVSDGRTSIELEAGGGKGGLRLSSFGGEPESDFDSLTKSAGGRRVNRAEPAESLLYLKASRALQHAGATPTKPGTREAEILLSVRVWPKAVAVYYNWVHQSLAQNKPYDQFARELLTSTGSNFRVGPANFVIW